MAKAISISIPDAFETKQDYIKKLQELIDTET